MADYPTFDALVERAQSFQRHALVTQGLSAATANRALARGTPLDLEIRMIATLVTGVYGAVNALEDQQMPDRAVGDQLVRLAGVFGVEPIAGARSTGSLTLTCTGTVTIAIGEELTAQSNGRKYRVTANYVGVPTGTLIAVESIAIGATNDLPEGAVLNWSSPPSGVASTATVASGGLTGGAAADTDATLRRRLLRLLREPQNGGNWAHVKQWLEEANANVESAYVYPAIQGPATVHAAITIAGTADNVYSREASSALVTAVNNYALTQLPEHAEFVLTRVAHEDLSLALRLTLPEPATAGGVGGGWVDPVSGSVSRWPTILASGLPVTVTSVTNSTTIVVNATAVPVVGATIDLWDSTARTFVRARVLSYTGGSGAYTIVLDTPAPTIVAGDYVCPASEQASEYARVLLETVAALGPGEKTSDATILARSYRHPRPGESGQSGVDTNLLAPVFAARPEVTGLRFSAINLNASFSLPVLPTVPATVTSPPNVWRIKRLGLYP